MALATPADFIKSAMRKHGALRSGGTPTNQQYADFLDSLNLMLRGWSKDTRLQAVQYTRTFTWAANIGSKTLGPSGADFTNARPTRIINASFKDTVAGVVYPVKIIPKNQNDQIAIPATGGVPYELNVQWGLTNLTLIPYYVPAQEYQLRLSTLEPISEYTAITNPIGLPIEYHKALLFNLCLEVADDLGREPTRKMILTAQEELDSIRELHAVPPPEVPVARMLSVASNRRWNINDGGFGYDY